ncbi:Tropinone reductase-like [Arachis hypogaea]|nr:Tropinone reductase-like [Arachis hypogaea]
MEKKFKGKVAIVTASTQGIGFAIAERLGLEGASVVISSRKQQNVDEAAEKLRAKGIEVLALVCHVSNDQQRKDLIQKTAQKYGKIDVIVSNAAANPSVDPILQTKDSVLDKLWEINIAEMEKRFKGKVAIVTASTQGIGFAIAERLGLEGASVVISSRKQQNVDEAAEKLRAKGIEVLALVCHVSNDQQRKDLIQKTAQKYGKIDVIVSNAAANPSVDPILQTKDSVLDKLWEINVKASILLLKDAAPHLHKGSSVVIVSSIAGFNPPASMSMYGVTKTALFGLTKALAAEMAPNTRVNCIAPGFVPTNFASFITSNQAIRQELEAKTLLGRLGTTEDMAAGTAFLASDDASYITGETLVIAGGMPSRL